jgi:hypothetical protein
MGGFAMFQRLGLLAATAALLVAGSAHADGLKPIEGESFTLGAVTGIVYYTEGAAGYRVVATMTDATDGTVVRFVATLAPEQSVTLSTPRGAGEPAIEVRLVRHGDKLSVDGDGPTARGAAVTELAAGP